MTKRETECARLAPTVADLILLQDEYEARTGNAGSGLDAIELMESVDPDYLWEGEME